MKRFQQWFNGLTTQQQKRALVIFCLLFGLLLLLSISYQTMKLNTGNITQPRIKSETLKRR